MNQLQDNLSDFSVRVWSKTLTFFYLLFRVQKYIQHKYSGFIKIKLSFEILRNWYEIGIN